MKSCENCNRERCGKGICGESRVLWEPIEKVTIKTFNIYQQATERTDNHESQSQALINFGLGIGGEAGEVQDVIKKHLFHGHLLDKEKIKNELGDVLWYIARIAKWSGLTLEEVAQGNIDKLKRRYPDGFDKEKSINREEGI